MMNDPEAGYPASGSSVITKQLENIYDCLLQRFGHQGWWPGEAPFEIIVGAILVQRTTWKNVETVVSQLKAEKLLNAQSIIDCPHGNINELLKPTGFFRQKSARLKAMSDYLVRKCGGEIDRLSSTPTGELRKELLEINGIGPETADSILLYAFVRPVFVIDAYTIRALNRIGISEGEKAYGDVQALFMNNLPLDVGLYKDFHAQWVALGKQYCRSKPACDECPLTTKCKYID